MSTLAVLVADDEPLAVRRLTQLLEAIPDVEIRACATRGEEVLAAAAAHAPDLLLLDIEMPHMDGFDVIDALVARHRPDDPPPPLIVFVTAYAEFAALAFDTGAVDFLTKPVRLQRLERAIVRARAAIAAREAPRRLASLQTTLDRLRAGHAQQLEDRALWIHSGGDLIRVDPDAIEWVQAEGEYVRLHIGGRSYLHRALLGRFLEELDPDRFMRVHRSFLVRRDCVTRVSRTRWGSLTLRIGNDTVIPVGRKYNRAAMEIYQ